MFYTRGHVLRLLATDVSHAHLRREKRVFTEIFKIPAAQRCSQNVHSRSEHDVLAARASLLADHFAGAETEIRIPCRGETYARGHGRRKIIGSSRGIPGVRPDVFADS